MKTQMKAVWAILVMTTIWLTMNSSKINGYADEQSEIDKAVSKMVKKLEERDREETQELTFEEAFSNARAELGKGEIFVWKGNTYTTDYAEKSTYIFPSDDIVGRYVRNSDDFDDYCSTNDRDVCGVCGGNGAETWYADRDADGLGDANTSVVSCEQPEWGFHSK